MPEDDPYTALADWYDVEHDAITEDIEFFAQQIADLDVARPRVLEVGSGTGRIAAGLALAGYEVVGIEPSAAMRARLSGAAGGAAGAGRSPDDCS